MPSLTQPLACRWRHGESPPEARAGLAPRLASRSPRLYLVATENERALAAVVRRWNFISRCRPGKPLHRSSMRGWPELLKAAATARTVNSWCAITNIGR